MVSTKSPSKTTNNTTDNNATMTMADKVKQQQQQPDTDKADNADQTEEDKVHESYKVLCRELNMDSATVSSAWEAYTEIIKKYTLEVS